MIHTLPKLSYSYGALEPFIDARTMEIHYTKHHQTYVDKLNAALEKYPKLQGIPTEELLRKFDSLPDEIKTAVRNHGGGHANHSLFWQILKKDVKFDEKSKIGKAIIKNFGSYEKFKEEFIRGATTLFGSGWTWLSIGEGGKLEVANMLNQDNPLIVGKKPILGLDVWEHAYYLKYQNRRAEYIEAFFKIINWKKVDEIFGR